MDDFAERTVPATERRRREARVRGEVAISRELSAALILVVTTVSLWFLTPRLLKHLVLQMRSALTHQSSAASSLTDVTGSLSESIRVATASGGPILLVILLAALASQLVQTGWIWAPARLVPRFHGRGLFLWNSATAASFSVFKLILIGCVIWQFMSVHSAKLGGIGLGEPAELMVHSGRILCELAIQTAVVLFVCSLADYALQYWRFEQSLKMTVQEQRREQREDQGQPEAKRRRKELRVQMPRTAV